MSTRREAIALLIAIATFAAKAIDSPADVTIHNVTSNSFFVNFTKSEAAVTCEVTAIGKFLSSDIHTFSSNSEAILISGLGSNIRYEVRSRCFAENGTASAYTSPVEVRTYPNGSKVTASRPLPHIFTVFLDPIPGARQWIIEVVNLNATTVGTYVLDSPYKIFRDAGADTTYRIRARISRINSNDLPEAKSPFGDPLLVTTAKLSVFGRVVLRTQTYETALSEKSSTLYKAISQKWEVDLLKEYSKTQPMAVRVQILEFKENVALGTIAHHEIFVSGSTLPSVDSFVLSNGSLFDDFDVTADVNPSYGYQMFQLGRVLEFYFDPAGEECLGYDKRTFLLNRYNGWTQILDFSSKETSNILDELSNIEFTKNAIKAGSNSSELQTNSLYTIDQSYLFKMCQASDSSSFLYSRRYTANYSEPGYNGTFVNSTGPPPMKTEDIPYRVSENLREITIEMEPVYRAQEYDLSIDGTQNLTLVDVDSSHSIQATLTGYGMSQRYCIMMSVTINHPDWSREASEPSCFPFYSGSPNATKCRVIEVTDEKFRVIFDQVKFSTSYIIEITNSSHAHNYTTTTNSYIFSGELTPRASYNVRVATKNPFGIGMFSETKTTKFWHFSDVSNSSMKLTWDNDTVDLFYNVGIIQGNSVIKVYTNQIILSDLEAGVLYDVNVTVLTTEGSSLLLFSDRQITIPAVPSNLTFLSNSKEAITVDWAQVIGADFYTVVVEDAGMRINTSLTTVKLQNLDPGTGYNVEVFAQNSVGAGLGIIKRFFTVFETPRNLSTTNTTSNGFVLNWNGGDGAVNFEISISTPDWTKIFNTTKSGIEITDLIPSTSYSVIVKANYPDGSSTTDIVHFVTAPKTPTNMTLISRTSDELKISWLAVANASSYDIYTNGVYVKTVTSNSAEISRLSGGTVYTISVITVAFGGQRSDRATNNFRTLPSSPEISVSNVTQTSLYFTWSRPQGAESFRIIVTSQLTGFVVKEEMTTLNAILISNLTAGVEYNITATSISEGDHSDPPYTRQAVTVCHPPSGVVVTSVTHNAVTMKWDATQGAQEYEVVIQSTSRKRRSLEDGPKVTITSTTAKVENLAPASSYHLTVVAVNSAGRSVSDPITVETGARNPPELRLLNVTTSSIAVEWDEQVGATNYRLHRTNSSGESDTLLVGLNHNAEMKSLFPGTWYKLSLTTSSQIQPGSKDFENKFMIPNIIVITVPLPPAEIDVKKTTEGNKIFVQWKESIGASLYIVKMTTGSRNSTFNTTGLNITVDPTSDLRFAFTVTAMNAQNRMSDDSIPVKFSLEGNEAGERTAIPWWVILIVCAVIVVIIISLLIWWVRRRPPDDQLGFYNVQYPDRQQNVDEVATDYVTMETIETDGGYCGPQDATPDDEGTAEMNEIDNEDQSEPETTENCVAAISSDTKTGDSLPDRASDDLDPEDDIAEDGSKNSVNAENDDESKELVD